MTCHYVGSSSSCVMTPCFNSCRESAWRAAVSALTGLTPPEPRTLPLPPAPPVQQPYHSSASGSRRPLGDGRGGGWPEAGSEGCREAGREERGGYEERGGGYEERGGRREERGHGSHRREEEEGEEERSKRHRRDNRH